MPGQVSQQQCTCQGCCETQPGVLIVQPGPDNELDDRKVVEVGAVREIAEAAAIDRNPDRRGKEQDQHRIEERLGQESCGRVCAQVVQCRARGKCRCAQQASQAAYAQAGANDENAT